ncbi:MAG: DNA-3-methyladenine glycosylase I [Alphaproteobacteria bacterium]|nr:MAG: DNA-3-methyladenine glycosylase I [Alphaproteobacteria bacterium]
MGRAGARSARTLGKARARRVPGLREAFDGFDPVAVARYDEARIGLLLQNSGIIRSRAKIEAAIAGARVWLEMAERGEDFSDYIWGFVDGRPIQNAWRGFRDAPTATPVSEALAKDLKRRGFKFCGPVITYAFMQAVGMVNDHETGCPRHAQCAATP